MSTQKKGVVWLWAGVPACLPTALGWLAAPYPPPMYGYRVEWLSNLGLAIQLPGLLVITFFTFVVPGGFHNHDYFYRATPLPTWIFYTLLFYWFLSRRRAN
jgi:hypothetical protein